MIQGEFEGCLDISADLYVSCKRGHHSLSDPGRVEYIS
jgi:hypothetical protein